MTDVGLSLLNAETGDQSSLARAGLVSRMIEVVTISAHQPHLPEPWELANLFSSSRCSAPVVQEVNQLLNRHSVLPVRRVSMA